TQDVIQIFSSPKPYRTITVTTTAITAVTGRTSGFVCVSAAPPRALGPPAWPWTLPLPTPRRFHVSRGRHGARPRVVVVRPRSDRFPAAGRRAAGGDQAVAGA